MTDSASQNTSDRSQAVLILENGSTLPEETAWLAVAGRDRRFDGTFVYGVQTTGVYCRPSCPARRPNRENVTFYSTPAAAETAGYRPCRRCHPEQVAGTPAEQAVAQARAHLDAHLDDQVTLDALATEVGLSPGHLQRTFKRFVGLSPRQYQDARRLEAFKEHVGEERNVLEATYEAGFGSSRALYDQAGAALGMTPGTYRRGGQGLAIRFTTLASTLGRVLVAVTERGICAVLLGEADDALVAELEEEFPNAASIERADDEMGEWVEPIVRYLDGAPAHPTVPLALQGTDFQRKVWTTLQQIPYGETRSYGEVAQMVGQPGAARAVAQACANNRVALVVPCHRVVRADGSPGGYRWGVERKRQLLQQESPITKRVRTKREGDAANPE